MTPAHYTCAHPPALPAHLEQVLRRHEPHALKAKVQREQDNPNDVQLDLRGGKVGSGGRWVTSCACAGVSVATWARPFTRMGLAAADFPRVLDVVRLPSGCRAPGRDHHPALLPHP